MGNIRGGAFPGLLNQPTGQTINGSLLFNGPQYLTRTPGTAGNRKSWTFSAWVKRWNSVNDANSYSTIFGANSDGMELMISNSGVFNFYDYSGGAYQYRLVTSRVLRDPTAWFHVVAVADTTNSTAGDRWRLYINGTRVTNFSTETYGSQNYDSGVNSTGLHVLGRYGSGADTVRKAEIYLTNTHLIDGSSLDPSYFGFTDPLTNTWRPKKYTGTFGTNGFFLPMDNQDNFEKDKSGNGNDFTKNNFSGTFNDPDVFKDSPSGAVFGGRAQTGITTTSSAPANYATLNPLNVNDMDGTASVLVYDGNLTMRNERNTYFGTALSTLSMTSGKYYCEGTVDSNDATTLLCGILKIDPLESRWNTDDEQIGYFNNGYGYRSNNGNKENNLSNSSYGNSYGDGDTIGIALDLDAKTISFYKNGTNQGVAYSGIPAGQYAFGFSCSETNNKWKANFGQKPFKYAPPQGFLPLNSATVRPNTVVPRPDQYVGISTWSGNNVDGRLIETSFEPDFVWQKRRDGSSNHNLYDTIRGAGKRLSSDSDGKEENQANPFLKTFEKNGFTVYNDADINGSSGTHVAWCWKAGGSKNTFNVDDVGYASAGDIDMGVGDLNSVSYNKSQTWSGQVSGTQNGSYPFTNMFNADGEATHAYPANGTTATFTPSPSFSNAKTVKVWYYAPTINSNTFQLNGVNVGDQMTETSGTLTHTFKVDGFTSWSWSKGVGGDDSGMLRIDVDGVQLVDSGVSTPNVPSTAATGCSVGTKQGFSIIKYTGPNDTNNNSVPHGLLQAPDFIITKNLDTTFNWDIYHSSLADDKYMIFTTAEARNQGFSGRPTSKVFNTEHDYSTNENQDYIAYCWHDVPGLQKFGFYIGNGDADGPFIELGFRPAVVIIKRSDGGLEPWAIYDSSRGSTNPNPKGLYVNDPAGENDASGRYKDFLSNGFKVRGSSGEQNGSGQTYIYAAWAEAPSINLYGSQSNAR